MCPDWEAVRIGWGTAPSSAAITTLSSLADGTSIRFANAPPHDGDDQSVDDIPWPRLDAKYNAQSRALRQVLILQGIDFNGARALVGICHTDEVVEDTLTGFAAAVRMVEQEGLD